MPNLRNEAPVKVLRPTDDVGWTQGATNPWHGHSDHEAFSRLSRYERERAGQPSAVGELNELRRQLDAMRSTMNAQIAYEQERATKHRNARESRRRKMLAIVGDHETAHGAFDAALLTPGMFVSSDDE